MMRFMISRKWCMLRDFEYKSNSCSCFLVYFIYLHMCAVCLYYFTIKQLQCNCRSVNLAWSRTKEEISCIANQHATIGQQLLTNILPTITDIIASSSSSPLSSNVQTMNPNEEEKNNV